MHSRVTIAIPTYNREKYLQIALDSALAQTYSNLEIVVSNNASSDNTAALLESITDPRLRAVEQKNTVGMMENWNACLSIASGTYFLLLSDDDVLEPTAIAEMVDVFEDNERKGRLIGFVYCGGKMIDRDGEVLLIGRTMTVPPLESASELIVEFFNGKRNLWPCAILFRKADLDPGYDLKFPLAADAAQWMRAVVAYSAARYVDRRLVRYRVHQNTTVMTGIDVWRKENTALAEFAIDELRKKGDDVDDLAEKIRVSVCRLNVRVTVGLINQSHKDQKLNALSAYLANFRVFTSVYGVLVLIRGTVLLVLPKVCQAWVRRCLHFTTARKLRRDEESRER